MSDKVLIKADLIRAINEQVGLNNREAREFVEIFFEELRTVLTKHEDIKISGFGRFSVRHKYPRPGRNPKTGEDATISERWVVTFNASAKLRDRIHNSPAIEKKVDKKLEES